MNNTIKYILYALLFIAIIGGVLFSGILTYFGTAVTDSQEAISFIPIEVRVGFWFIMGGLALALGKTFFK